MDGEPRIGVLGYEFRAPMDASATESRGREKLEVEELGDMGGG